MIKNTETHYESWGRFPRVSHRRVKKVFWRDQLPEILQLADPGSLLPFGMGRSYGDSCLNENRDLLDCTPLNRILEFDWETGRIRVEAGITLADLLDVIVPRGWFLPVTPGTKYVTVGGAIANDIHGKNHHRAGTLGCHIDQIMLYRSDAGSVLCSPSNETDIFRATVGGLGLTGVIGWADLRLKRIAGNSIDVETVPFGNLDEFLDLSRTSDETHEYTVAWADCLSGGRIRGIFFRGNHAGTSLPHRKRHYTLPVAVPEFVLSRGAVAVFNRAYYALKARNSGSAVIHYDSFFYPLDAILKWNLLYGTRGFVQYQCLFPPTAVNAVKETIEAVSKSGEGCFLAVLKAFGNIRSPGLLSFPRPGVTLALDLPMRGARTGALLDALDQIVLSNGGALYPAKDARMSPAMFEASFPNWSELTGFIDPRLSSSFWRRVTRSGNS